MGFSQNDFKLKQLGYSRVRDAYNHNEENVLSLLEQSGISKNFAVYLRAFKKEQMIELWAKNTAATSYKLLKTYHICKNSGGTGPKRKQGDFQVPEGFYHIDRFNPKSKFHLSLGINYPNKSDKILGDQNPGGDIFIHGACETVGCLPITDEKIAELYIFCIEAIHSGQSTIPVTIFPQKLSDLAMSELKAVYSRDQKNLNLWYDLKKAFDYLNASKKLPQIKFLSNGSHEVLPAQ